MSSSARKKLVNEIIPPECRISIGIPARDEAEYLHKTLEAFAKQKNLKGLPLDKEIFEIVLLLNNCSDDSLEIARNFKAENQNLNFHIAEINTSKENANGGFIRRILLDELYFRLTENGRKDGIIMTTDGDTQIADDWIAANVFEIENGADAVGGRINFAESELEKMNRAARKLHLLDEEYRLLVAKLEDHLDHLAHDPFPRHHQHFNGSFAVKGEIYKKAGGVPQVSCMEDVAFYEALLRIDAKFRHSTLVNVYTSARASGRTEIGLSTQINDWINLSEQGEDFLVESAAFIEERLKLRNDLRKIWQKKAAKESVEIAELQKIASRLFVSLDDLSKGLQKQNSFGAFLEKAFQNRSEQENQLVPVGEAVKALRKKTKNLRLANKTKVAVG